MKAPNEFRVGKTKGNPHGTSYSWLAKSNFIYSNSIHRRQTQHRKKKIL